MTKEQNLQNKLDDSAMLQGRKPIGVRIMGKSVNTKHMTPKEYLNYKAGIWNGIEIREGTQNWQPFEWPQDSEPYKKTPKKKRKNKGERRGPIRRKDDYADTVAYYLMMFILFFIVFVWSIVVKVWGA